MNQELTREELYEKVWSAPTTQIAAELGISDVALGKRCKKWNVPKPSLGYWAKVAAGQKPAKAPLPATVSEAFIQAAEKPLAKTLSLPETNDQLHPLAAELMKALTAGKSDSQKRISLRERALPEVNVTRALIERAAKSFHVILNGVESLGITFRKAQGSYESGGTTRRPSWHVPTGRQIPSGLLSFSLGPERYAVREAKQWKEDDKFTFGERLAQIVAEIRGHYVAAQKRREQEVIEREKQRIESERRWREHQEKGVIRCEEERRQNHARALETIVPARTEDLVKAAEWWRIHRVVAEFISECERRWRNGRAGELTKAQVDWLNWAHENAKAMSPFEVGYPDPANDGPFDPAGVPFGGPYPAKRDFPRPPTLPKIPPPVVQQSGYGHASIPETKPFPFWLKHPRR